MLDTTTKRRIDDARDILVGKIPDPKSQVEQITIALIYKFMDDMDLESEELGGKAHFFSGEYQKYSWRRVYNPTRGGQEILFDYREALQKMSECPNLPTIFHTIFRQANLPYNDPETLKSFLKIINSFEYDHSERLGDAFEYLLSVLGSQGDAGQFRTPRHIIDFMVDMVEPKKGETILDPACGTAGFLISAYKYILKQNSSNGKHHGDLLNPDERKQLSQNITGYDISPDMVRLSLVNMYLHRITEPKITEYDTLTSDTKWNEYFDIILANPPFMSPKGGIKPHSLFSIQSKRSEALFVDYIVEHLTLTGRSAIIVPEGVIFKTDSAFIKLRKMLIEENYLYGVISLPSGVFNPYSGVKTSILLLDKVIAKLTDKILFAKVENDGFALGAQRRPIEGGQLKAISSMIHDFKVKLHCGEDFENKMCTLIRKSKIAKSNDYNLNEERYFSQKQTISKYKYVELCDVVDYEQPGAYIVNSVDYSDDYSIPVLTAGKTFILGKTNETFGIFPESKLPVIIFDDFTTATKFVDFPFKVKSSAIKILHAKRDKILPIYLYYIIQNIKFECGNHKRYWISEYSKIKIPLPSLEEQRAIVAEIESCQKIINAAHTIVDNYIPQIVIKSDCRMVKLGDENIFEIQSGGTPDSKNSSYWNGSINWATLADLPQNDFITTLSETERKITESGLQNSSAKLLPPCSILVSSRATIGRIAINETEIATNQGFKNILIKDKKKAYYKYIAYVITSLRSRMEALAIGGTFKEISKRNFTTLEIPLPPLEEQKMIVAQIEEEELAINNARKIIDIFEHKITKRVSQIWEK